MEKKTNASHIKRGTKTPQINGVGIKKNIFNELFILGCKFKRVKNNMIGNIVSTKGIVKNEFVHKFNFLKFNKLPLSIQSAKWSIIVVFEKCKITICLDDIRKVILGMLLCIKYFGAYILMGYDLL